MRSSHPNILIMCSYKGQSALFLQTTFRPYTSDSWTATVSDVDIRSHSSPSVIVSILESVCDHLEHVPDQVQLTHSHHALLLKTCIPFGYEARKRQRYENSEHSNEGAYKTVEPVVEEKKSIRTPAEDLIQEDNAKGELDG